MKFQVSDLFQAQAQWQKLEGEFADFLEFIEISDSSYELYSFDSQDYSFELIDCQASLVLTLDQQSKFWDVGFNCGWLNYKNNTERYYSPALPLGLLRNKSGK